MKNVILIGAGGDLGVNIDGASLSPRIILNKCNFPKILLEQDKNIIKSQDKNDLKKNLKPLNEFNQKLYETILKEKKFCFTIGGDHSISIASSLASLKKQDDLGLIWIDSHLDYNTFETTITGNLHGLPLATLNGLNKDLSKFHNGSYFNPKKTVVVGYRAFEANASAEINNIKTMGVTVFTTKDIQESGVSKIMDMAFKIASPTNNFVHVSIDLDVIDPQIAPGVSVKEKDGLLKNEINQIIDYLKTKESKIKSLDLVEYNPLNDKDNKTLDIALDIINKLTND